MDDWQTVVARINARMAAIEEAAAELSKVVQALAEKPARRARLPKDSNALSELDLAIVKYISSSSSKVSRSDVVQYIQRSGNPAAFDISNGSTSTILRRLVRGGHIEQIGSRGQARYVAAASKVEAT